MKRLLPLTLVAAFVVVAAAVALLSVTVDADQPAQASNTSELIVLPAGYVVHIDPATGNIVEQSPSATPVAIDHEMSNALSTSFEGLKEVPSPVRGGGMMIDLQGRFQNSMVVVTDEDGNLTAPCISDPATKSEDDNATAEGKE
jgi:hypothetical protein